MKRYIVVIDMYVYAEDDSSAFVEAKDICKSVNKGLIAVEDAEVTAIYSKPFGEITEPRRVK